MEDKKFLADMSKNCAQKTAEWEERSKTRSDELVALADTIKVLNDDDALDLFKKTLPSAGSASFVQVSAGRTQQAKAPSLILIIVVMIIIVMITVIAMIIMMIVIILKIVIIIIIIIIIIIMIGPRRAPRGGGVHRQEGSLTITTLTIMLITILTTHLSLSLSLYIYIYIYIITHSLSRQRRTARGIIFVTIWYVSLMLLFRQS